ncbi:MAG: right-handed parallel beta-helix repeat-containing protein, partial [Firmicutes bacterium]|nr:right-handed parallel beta-helix repeat-containing protein [Bacillota bacterium]
MKKSYSRGLALLLSAAMLVGSFTLMPAYAETPAVTVGIESEALYGEWQGSGSYNVYYKAEGASSFIKIDDALVRNDGNGGYRAEVLGLKGGVNYTVKAVPVSNGSENEAGAFTFTGTPKSYDRSGYAHFNTTNNPGAYNLDGTLPTDADINYVNDSNKDSVKLGNRQGLANIISGYNKGDTPLVVRLIGRVTEPSGTSTKMVNVKGTAGLTIEGVGTDSGLYGWGFNVSDGSDIEFRNLHFDWNYEDAVGMQSSSRVWVHDNTFTVGNQNPPTESDKAHGDGSCDAKTSDYVTISYNHFIGTAKTCLLGSSPSKRETVGHYSYHHNFWDGTEQRCPRVRWHDVHVYNNYYKNVGFDLDDGSKIGYGVAAANNSSIFVENNYFENTYRPMLTSDANCSTLSKNDGGVIKAFGNFYDEFSLSTMETKDRFEAPSKDYQLTAADYTASKGGWTYDNFDTSSSFYKDAYFLESAQD